MLVSAKEMLNKAKAGHYAVGQFNINNLEWTKAILLAAEDLNLASCWIDEVKALNQSEKFYDYQDQFQIPEGYEFMGGVALGERLKTPEEPEQRRGTWRIIE